MSNKRNVLVLGATGKQGKALIRALLHSTSSSPSSQRYHIFALTRSAESIAAKALREIGAEDDLTVVEGNLDDEEGMRKVFDNAKKRGGVWGVFAVLAYPGLGAEADGEERQGKLIADLALLYGVETFIYSSSMRSGPKYVDGLKLSGRAKANVERHCMELGEKGLPWTILRPSFFMENFEGFLGSIAVTIMKTGLKPDTTIALIASEDIGNVAASVFKDSEIYKHKILTLVSEFSTISQIEDSHQRALGTRLPAIPSPLGWLLTKINKATQGLISDLELNHYVRVSGEYPEHEAEIALARSAFKMKTYQEWKSQERKEDAGGENWNQVSLGKLLTGRA
ncbi:hypothetical protein BGZ60DRAFT_465721 [Tricladium varicosporioides]|nr:hypothetical protein BGZ60DRAFT_465721 [Hymenoscyphus varicosporioides]